MRSVTRACGSSPTSIPSCRQCPHQGWVRATGGPRGLAPGCVAGAFLVLTFGFFCLCVWQPQDFRDLPEWEPRIREAFRTGDLDSKPDPSRTFRPYRAEDNDSYASEVGLCLSMTKMGPAQSRECPGRLSLAVIRVLEIPFGSELPGRQGKREMRSLGHSHDPVKGSL